MGIFSFSCYPNKKKNKNYDFILKMENDKEILIDNITLKIHICGIGKDDKRIRHIFSDRIDDNEESENNLKLHQTVFYWLIKLYSKELNDTTFDEICKEIKNDRDNLDINIKQNTILYFEDNPNDSHLKNIFLKKIGEIGFIYRPRIIFITKKRDKFDLKDNRYITNIIWNDEPEEKKLFEKIIATIWNIDCYFNQRLNEIEKFNIDEPKDIFKGLKENPIDYSINILLTGLSRGGKSSFINLVRGKLTALESNDKESVTSKLTDYNVNIKNDNNDEEYCSIKLIDSPGMVYDFNENFKNKNIVIDSLKEAFDDNSINKIDIILFFFLENNSLETAKEILKILNEKKFTVIFIINRCTDEEENGGIKEITSTLSFLRQNNFTNLAKKENFIPCNLKGSTRSPFYGMKEIWKRIYEILENENRLIISDSLENKIKDYLEEIKKEKITDRMIFEKDEKNKKSDNIFQDIYKNTLFSKIKKNTIIKKCRDITQTSFNTINKLSCVNLSEFFDNIPNIHIFESILYFEIGKNYGFQEKDIHKKFEQLKNKLEDYIEEQIKEPKKSKKKDKAKKEKDKKEKDKKEKDKKEKDKKKEIIKEENDKDKDVKKLNKRKKTIFKKVQEIIDKFQIIKEIGKKLKEYQEIKNKSEEYKNFFENNKLIEIIGNISQQFFEEELQKEEYIPYFYKYLNIYKNCFKYIKKLSEKENWEIYEPEYINANSDCEDENNININDNISINNKSESKNITDQKKNENKIINNIGVNQNEIKNNDDEKINIINEVNKNNDGNEENEDFEKKVDIKENNNKNMENKPEINNNYDENNNNEEN